MPPHALRSCCCVCAALCVVLIAASEAQDIAPELAPLVAKRNADLAALKAQKEVALGRLRQQYLAALDGAEKTATSSGRLEEVAAIVRERAAITSGPVAPAFSSDLPKTLQTARKSFLDGSARAVADLAPRQKMANADYLRALATLQAKAAVNPELATQIATEKEKLLAGAGSERPVQGGPATSGRNALLNGSFDSADPDGGPSGWKVRDRGEVTFRVVREGTNSMLRMTVPGTPKEAWMTQDVPVPPRAKTVTVRGRIRGKWVDRTTDDSNWGANLTAIFRGPDDKAFGGWLINVAGHEPGWKTYSKSMPVKSGAKTLYVHVGSQWVAGTFDFDEIEVEFR